MHKNFDACDILHKLAKDYAIVLLGGNGFAAPKWSIRVSLANLDDRAYITIGASIKNILNDYVELWKSKKTN